jgi:nucleoside-diphosphate-sugar epimerase
MNNKISVFGPTGFIGGRFCEMFPNNVVKIDRNDCVPVSNNVLYFISTVDNYNIHDDLHVDIDTNLKVLMNVLENVKKNPNITFNFVSSWFVYGQTNDMPFKEDTTICNPTGFYSITKYAAEQMLICFCNTFNIKYRIFRLANVLGENDKKFSAKKNAIQFLINRIVNSQEIPLYDGGEVLRDYIYVDDVCNALKLCVEAAPTNQIINIGSGRPYRFMDVIEHAMKISNSRSRIINIETPKFHQVVQVKHSYLHTGKLKSYGFKQTYSIEQIVQKLVDFYTLTKQQ